MKYILGIQSYANHDSGACIIKFGKNVEPEFVAISEERLIRQKYPYTFPLHSILYCMKYFKIKNLKDINIIVSDWIRIKKWLRSGPSYNYQTFDFIKENLNFNKKKIIQINHHLAHAASTYYSSHFNSSAILIVDGNGSDVETNSYYLGINNKIKFIDSYKNYGIGAAYGAVTKEVLNLGTGGEGKTMGLAPYGKYNKRINIGCKIKGIETNFEDFMMRMPFSDVLNHINPNFRPKVIKQKICKVNKSKITQRKYADWAYMIQNTAEKIMIKLGKDLYNKTKQKNICLAGGVALNSVANEKLFKKNKFKDIFIFPACADAGIPYGLAVWAYHNLFGNKKRIKFDNAYTGIVYNKNKIKNLLKKLKINFRVTNEMEIAKLISKEKIIGNFNQGSEYGPRALGNRSILADPRVPQMRNFINKKIKHREMFRPFAPAILEEKCKEYFDLKYSPFMLRVANCKSKKIPATLHIDNTARVQTVNQIQNNKFYKIIKNFYNLTGVPVVLNTSFNDAGEPLVESPLDALISAIKTNLDYLVIEDYLISVKSISHKRNFLKKLLKLRKKIIKENELKAIKKLTKKHNKENLKNKIKINNNAAWYNCIKRPCDKIENFLKNLDKSKPLVIIGSNDHTNILVNIFKKYLIGFDKIYYYEFKKNDIYKKRKKIKFLKKINKLKKIKDASYMISSFQYSKNINDMYHKVYKDLFSPYDNSSRSIIDYAYIEKFKGKNKLYSKNLF